MSRVQYVNLHKPERHVFGEECLEIFLVCVVGYVVFITRITLPYSLSSESFHVWTI